MNNVKRVMSYEVDLDEGDCEGGGNPKGRLRAVVSGFIKLCMKLLEHVQTNQYD